MSSLLTEAADFIEDNTRCPDSCGIWEDDTLVAGIKINSGVCTCGRVDLVNRLWAADQRDASHELISAGSHGETRR